VATRLWVIANMPPGNSALWASDLVLCDESFYMSMCTMLTAFRDLENERILLAYILSSSFLRAVLPKGSGAWCKNEGICTHSLVNSVRAFLLDRCYHHMFQLRSSNLMCLYVAVVDLEIHVCTCEQ
jgi:hypothetical protein